MAEVIDADSIFMRLHPRIGTVADKTDILFDATWQRYPIQWTFDLPLLPRLPRPPSTGGEQ